MGKTTIDFDDYEGNQYEEYQGDDPKPGWYTFELQKVGYTDDSEESLRWIFVVADGPYAGWPGFVFGNFDTTKWKNQETVRAVQGGAEKPVTLDWGNEKQTAAFVKKAKRVRGKVEIYTNRETGEARTSLRKVRPLLEDASTVKASASKANDLDDDLEATEVEGGDEPYTEEELAEMKLPALKAILKDEFDFSAADLRKLKTADAAIEAILEVQDEDEDEDADEADDDTDGDGGDDDFDDDFDEADGDDEDEDTEPEPEPEPAPRRRRGAAATKTAPAKKAAPAKAAAPAQRRRRRA